MCDAKTEVLFDSNSVVVVIDTNQIYDNYFMDSPRFELMLNSMEKLGYKLAFPQIVFDEVIYKYKERLTDTFNSFNSQAKVLRKLLVDENVIVPQKFDIVKHERAYKNFLLRLIRKYGTLLPHPSVPHELLAKKAVTKTKPFNFNGAGYRDALIWESVKNIVNNDQKTVVFITNNTADFSKGKGNESIALHDHLLDELVSKESVLYYLNIDTFNDEFITNHIAKINGLDNQFGDSIEKWLAANLYTILRDNEDWGYLSTGLSPDVGRYFLRKPKCIAKASIIEAYNTVEQHVFVKIKTTTEIEGTVDFDFRDYEYYREVRDWLSFEMDPGEDVSVEFNDQIELVFDLIINTSTSCVESSELIRMEINCNSIEY